MIICPCRKDALSSEDCSALQGRCWCSDKAYAMTAVERRTVAVTCRRATAVTAEGQLGRTYDVAVEDFKKDAATADDIRTDVVTAEDWKTDEVHAEDCRIEAVTTEDCQIDAVTEEDLAGQMQ